MHGRTDEGFFHGGANAPRHRPGGAVTVAGPLTGRGAGTPRRARVGGRALAGLAVCAALAAALSCAPEAHGHGLGAETISVDAGGRTLMLTAEVSQSDSENGRISIKAQEDDGAAVKNTTLMVKISHQGATILHERFFAPGGTLLIETRAAGEAGMTGEQESGTWMARDGEPLTLAGPTLASGGLYGFEIEIITVDEPDNALPDTGAHRMDVSVVETTPHIQTALDGGEAAFETKSYFDTVSGLEYDAQSSMATFSMPFDWREKSISHVPVVHVEVRFPKDLGEFVHPGYAGQVNGIDLFHASVVVDDYTDEEYRTVHFILLRDHIKSLKIKQQHAGQDIPDSMTFTLTGDDMVRFPLISYTLDEQFRIDTSWDPAEIRPGETTTFVFTIRDGSTGEPLRQSSYYFELLQDGRQIYRTSGNAVVGGSFETFTFSEEHRGQITVRFDGIRGTDSATEFSILVVPEFGAAAAAVLLAGVAAAALLRRSPLGMRV